MKRILFWGALVAGGWLLWRWYSSRGSHQAEHDNYLAEQYGLRQLSNISERARQFALDQIPPTRSEPSGLLGAVVSPTTGGGGAPDEFPWPFPAAFGI